MVLTLGENGVISGQPGWRFLSLIRDGEGPVWGVVALHQETLELTAFQASTVVAPAHGLGVTVSLLYRQGAKLANPEFFQFHPAFVAGGEIPFCLGDAVLKAGGRFWAEKNGKPWYFLEEIYPQLGNRVPNLVLNRTVHKISHDLGQVYLDLTRIDPAGELASLFSLLRRRFKLDPSKKSIPVAPHVSQVLGGLWLGANGETSIAGLFLSPLPPGGERVRVRGGESIGSLLDHHLQTAQAKLKQIFEAGGPENVFILEREMQECFNESMGVARDNRKLKKASEQLGELARRCTQIALADKGRRSNRELWHALTLPARVEAARAAVTAALLRNESREEHYKPEFPKQDDARFLKKTKVTWSPTGPQIEYEDVQSLF